ncbi:hypothetical protein K8352_14585 [Flavobacteriaceae bacterium F89]|uniref:Uncharacterized protein n=1 Tax=Cerina litoralis TaxID=2874477 RepID=A0AAE3JS22_9FLAO|nr:hypothetical protein [Cerina litoralis]MCG2461983.1 hypothetical protein [Cerina litoralis]
MTSLQDRFTKFLFVLFFLSMASYGQRVKKISNYYKWFDGIIGIENTGLYRGVEYVEAYRTINDEHKFFESPLFREGSIVYGGEPYFNVPMKYDLNEDQVLVNLDSKYGFSVFKLIQDQISDFTLDGHHFVRVNYKDKSGSNISGFEEILVSNPYFTFLKKYRKTPLERTKDRRLYYEFKSKNRYSLIYREVYYEVKNQNDIKKIFSEYKKEINGYSNKPLKNYDFDKYMKNVLEIVYASMTKDIKTSNP